jgi:hypothetical protein
VHRGRLYPLQVANYDMDTVEQRRSDLIARVRATLMEAGIPSSGCAKALSSVLGIAIAQAYRKFSGASVFTLPQIEAIEEKFGVQLLTVTQEPGTQLVKGSRFWSDATFVVEGRTIPCRVAVGDAGKAPGHRFVAFILKGQWYVYLAEEYSGKEPVFNVAAIQIATMCDANHA